MLERHATRAVAGDIRVGIKTEDGASVELLELKVGLSQALEMPLYVSGLVANASPGRQTVTVGRRPLPGRRPAESCAEKSASKL